MLKKLARNLFRVKSHRRVRHWASAQVQMEMLESRIVPTALLGLTTSNRLIQFDSSTPTAITRSTAVSGLASGEDLVSIDSRPANGLVYGLTNNNTLYTLNINSGVATRVGTGSAAFRPTGTQSEIDFNPSVDRLRVVTNAEQNFRIHPGTGGIVDGNTDSLAAGTQPDTVLAYADEDVNAGRNPHVIGAAYTQNFQGSTSTTLFGIDSRRNVLVTIGGPNGTPSPNGGQLSTIGALGVNAGSRLGFDIDDDGTAFAAINGRLYKINLGTGAATAVGKIGSGTALDSLTALPREEVIFAVTATNRLVSFRANDPGRLLSSVPISVSEVDLDAEVETISAIDFRPATGVLFALTSTNRTLTINTVTGEATAVGTAIAESIFAAESPAGLDFNPTVDRLRIVNSSNDNLRLVPDTAAVVDGNTGMDGTQGDTDLAFIDGDANVAANPSIVASAYDLNDNDVATMTTTLFGIDSALNILVRQGAVGGGTGTASPNAGLLTTLGSLGVDPTDLVGFDISGAGSGGNGVALAVMQLQVEVEVEGEPEFVAESVSKLFQINTIAGLSNQALGTASLVGTVGGGELITAMAIAPPTIQFSQATFRATEKGLVANIVITRTGGSATVNTVNFSALAGPAMAGNATAVTDFTAVTNSLVTFAVGETSKTVQVLITKDKVREAPEDVFLTLSGVTGGNTQLGLASATLVIKDK